MIRIAQALMLSLALLPGLLVQGSAQTQTEFRGFTQAELDQMLAPVALYPDTVLSHVLIAATYPIEVVHAARWTRQNQGLRGEEAVNAVIGQDWDPSVMALVAFPELLARMDADLDWTQRLGDAFLIQEHEVLDSIQRLRAQAYHAGHLRNSEQVRVIREREVIYIEPPRRQVVFVPVYDTRVVYGSWAWAHHPPVYWYSPPRHRRSVFVHWGPAYHVPPAFFFSSFHWSRREVVVVHHHHHYFRPHHPRSRTVVHHHHHYRGRDLARHDAAQRWQHDPGHRRGVAYHSAVDDRHRRLEHRSTPNAAGPSAPPVRVAETRNSQREWAAERRAEAILPQSGGELARSSRSASERARATGADSNLRAASTSVPRSAGSAVQRSPDRAAGRSAERVSPATAPARSVERQIQNRTATQAEARAGLRQSSTATAPAATQRAAPPGSRAQADPRAAARLDRARMDREGLALPRSLSGTPQRVAPAAPATRANEARTAPRSEAAIAPPRPAAAPANPGTRAQAAPATRSAPSRPAAAPPLSRVPEARAPTMPRSGVQNRPQPAASPRAETRSQPDRRPTRRVD